MVLYHFKTSDGPDLGPISPEDFRQRQESGEINDETMVWRSGLTDWMTYAALRAADERAAQPKPAGSSPPPLKKAASAKAEPRAAFFACGSCQQEWPEGLLSEEGGQKICGNCLNLKKQRAREGRQKAGAGTGRGAWALIILAVVCAGCLWYKVSHYGIRLPKEPVKELSAPATYGK
jgi:hypothetical protein